MTDLPPLPPLNGETAGRLVAAGGAMTALQCVSIGPENRAVSRSFGVRTALPNVSVDGRMLLEDLAAALSEWNQAPDLPFAMLMRLPKGDATWILLRGAFVGVVATGNISILHGVLIPDAVMDALGNRAHRLLPAIQLPSAEPWQGSSGMASAVQVDIGALARQPVQMIADMPRWLLRHPPCPTISIANTANADADLIAALDTLGLDLMATAPEWMTTKRLIAIGRFNPARFAITLPISGQRGDGADIVISNGHVEVRGALSPATIDDAWGMMFAGNSHGERWQAHFADLAIEDAIAGTLKGLFPASGQTDDYFNILGGYAQRIAAMPPAIAAQAVSGFAILFDALNGDQQQTAQALNLWIDKVWPYLPGLDMQPLDAALDKQVLDAISVDNMMAICGKMRREQVDIAAQKLRHWLNGPSADATPHPLHLMPTLMEIAHYWSRTYPDSIAAHALALDLFTSTIPAGGAHNQPAQSAALPGDDALIASANALLYAPSPLPIEQRVIQVMPSYLTLLSRSARTEDRQKLLDVVHQARTACRPGSGMTLANATMSEQNLRNLCVMHYFTKSMGGAGHG